MPRFFILARICCGLFAWAFIGATGLSAQTDEGSRRVIIEDDARAKVIVREDEPDTVIIKKDEPARVIVKEQPAKVIVREKPAVVIEREPGKIIVDEEPEGLVLRDDPGMVIVEDRDGNVIVGETPPLIVNLQAELKRVGCYRGEIDGAWASESAAALEAFYLARGLENPTFEPTEEALALVKADDDIACIAAAAPQDVHIRD